MTTLSPDQYYSVEDQARYNDRYIDTQTDDITYVRPELKEVSQKYMVIQDCIKGQLAVKSKRETYLPRPNPDDKSKANKDRYNSLLQRAIFYNFTAPTVLGLKGQCFIYDPLIKVPNHLKPLIKNVNGCFGVNQLAENCMTQTLSVNRGGLYTDYPTINRKLSKAEKERILPSIIQYKANQIINWNEISYDGKYIKSQIILCEYYNTGKGRFKPDISEKFRWLGLDNNNEYFVEVWVEQENGGFEISGKRIYPEDAKGRRWNEIPFTFLSSDGDSSAIVEPQMYDIASVNIGHYVNSASYEDSCNQIGEPTLVITGLPQGWLENELKGKVMMGSRGGLPLPVGGDAKLLQVAPNTMVFEAMMTKQKNMIAMGAKMVTESNVTKTATESVMDNSEQNSILMSNSKNNSLAITTHLNYCNMYLVGEKDESIEYRLLTENSVTNMTPQEQQQAVNNWYAGVLTKLEVRRKFRKSGDAFEDDSKIEDPKTDVPPQPPTAGKKKVGKTGTTSTKTGKNLPGNKNNN